MQEVMNVHLLVALHMIECIQLSHQHVFAACNWHHRIFTPCWLTHDQMLVLRSYVSTAASCWLSMPNQQCQAYIALHLSSMCLSHSMKDLRL